MIQHLSGMGGHVFLKKRIFKKIIATVALIRNIYL
jgi:hypothetical protein